MLTLSPRCYNTMKSFYSTVILLSLLVSSWAGSGKLKEVFSWKQVDYVWPSPQARQQALSKEQYVPYNNLPLGVEVYEDKLFVTVPRWKHGVPSSLNYIKLSGGAPVDKSPPLTPYPNWESNTIHENQTENLISTVISTFRVRVDSCKRLWVIDSGMVDLLGDSKQLSPPKIMVYDLTTDKLIRTHCLSKDVAKPGAFFANIAVDVCGQDCDNAHAYLPDIELGSLVVYSWKKDESWAVTHPFFKIDPIATNFNVAGVNFQWKDTIFGVSLSPAQQDCSRTLYFHPMVSFREFAVSTKIVQNKTIASDSYHEYKNLGYKGEDTQSTVSKVHEKSGVMFYTLLNKNALGCWNINKPFNENTQGIVDQDGVTLVFPNDMTVSGDDVWVLSDKLPVFVYSKLNPEEVNYRILKAPVSEAVKGTVCE